MKKLKSKKTTFNRVVIFLSLIVILGFLFPKISSYSKSNGLNKTNSQRKYEVKLCQCIGLEKRLVGKFPGEYTKYCMGIPTQCRVTKKFTELDEYTESVLELNNK